MKKRKNKIVEHRDKECYLCKKGPADMIRFTKDLKTKSIVYYCCRKCNTERMKIYYQGKGGENVRKAIKKSTLKHINKCCARQKVRYAIRTGKIIKPKTCEICKKRPKRIEGHHEDYNFPLKVIWVCTSCHADLDRKQKNKIK